MAHYLIAVIGEQVERQLEKAKETLGFDRYYPPDYQCDQYDHAYTQQATQMQRAQDRISDAERFTAYVKNGEVVRLSFYEITEMPMWAEIKQAAAGTPITIVDIHR